MSRLLALLYLFPVPGCSGYLLPAPLEWRPPEAHGWRNRRRPVTPLPPPPPPRAEPPTDRWAWEPRGSYAAPDYDGDSA